MWCHDAAWWDITEQCHGGLRLSLRQCVRDCGRDGKQAAAVFPVDANRLGCGPISTTVVPATGLRYSLCRKLATTIVAATTMHHGVVRDCGHDFLCR
jgi:hypothetical protein